MCGNCIRTSEFDRLLMWWYELVGALQLESPFCDVSSMLSGVGRLRGLDSAPGSSAGDGGSRRRFSSAPFLKMNCTYLPPLPIG